MGFNLVDLAITVRADDPFRLVNCLPLKSKAYADACRSLTCRRQERACDTCSSQDSCSWYQVFGQKLTSDPAALKRHQKPSMPFVFSFPMSDVFSEVHRVLECGLVVVGPAIQHLDMLLNGFAELVSSLASPHSAEIIQIACRDYQGTVQHSAVKENSARSMDPVPENLVILSTEGLLESCSWSGADLYIQLLTPLRLYEDGRPSDMFEFGRFARSVMRRVSSLASYYGESEYDCDFKEVSRQLEDVICVDNHFCYTHAVTGKLRGLIGCGRFMGDFSRIMPFLVIGSYVHTGKGSAFGMGNFTMVAAAGNRST